MTSPVFVGDIGTEIVLDCGQTITGATKLEIVARRPDGTNVTWTASADTTTAIKYATQANDLNQAGDWKLQAYIETASWKGRGAIVTLTVSDKL